MNGTVELHFVPTKDQVADIFTKPLDESTFSKLVGELGMLNLSWIVYGSKQKNCWLFKSNCHVLRFDIYLVIGY